jgi:hypothetical protein
MTGQLDVMGFSHGVGGYMANVRLSNKQFLQTVQPLHVKEIHEVKHICCTVQYHKAAPDQPTVSSECCS